jgi:GNAT superfamily N-acetyltransferase
MNISVARAGDLPDIVEMLAEYQASLEAAVPVEAEKNVRYVQGILENEQIGTIFIGRTSSKHPVAFTIVGRKPSSVDADWVPLIQDLFVRETYRRKGFGRQLFEHVVRWAKKNGHKQLCWQVENLNLTAQYMFDVYNPDVTGWVGYSLDLKKVT